jgi:hypothetical protein
LPTSDDIIEIQACGPGTVDRVPPSFRLVYCKLQLAPATTPHCRGRGGGIYLPGLHTWPSKISSLYAVIQWLKVTSVVVHLVLLLKYLILLLMTIVSKWKVQPAKISSEEKLMMTQNLLLQHFNIRIWILHILG